MTYDQYSKPLTGIEKDAEKLKHKLKEAIREFIDDTGIVPGIEISVIEQESFSEAVVGVNVKLQIQL